MIQPYDSKCYNCSTTAKNNLDSCNEVDIEVFLFFNPKLVSLPHFIQTYNASWRDERRPYTLANSGLDGALYLNFYGGVKYLNELYYQLPITHCTKPVTLAKGAKTKNAQACGTKYQKSLIHSKKKTTRKAAKKSYCYNSPLPATEVYYECRYDDATCVAQSIAQANGQAAVVAAILGMLLMTIATTFMGIPHVEHSEKGKKLKTKGWTSKCLIFVKVCTKGIKKQTKSGDEGGSELELEDLGKKMNLTKEELFEILDANDDGVLSRDEVGQGAKKIGLSSAQAVRIFDKLDLDGSGTLTMEKEAPRPELTLEALAEELCRTQAKLAEVEAALEKKKRDGKGASLNDSGDRLTLDNPPSGAVKTLGSKPTTPGTKRQKAAGVVRQSPSVDRPPFYEKPSSSGFGERSIGRPKAIL